MGSQTRGAPLTAGNPLAVRTGLAGHCHTGRNSPQAQRCNPSLSTSAMRGLTRDLPWPCAMAEPEKSRREFPCPPSSLSQGCGHKDAPPVPAVLQHQAVQSPPPANEQSPHFPALTEGHGEGMDEAAPVGRTPLLSASAGHLQTREAARSKALGYPQVNPSCYKPSPLRCSPPAPGPQRDVLGYIPRGSLRDPGTVTLLPASLFSLFHRLDPAGAQCPLSVSSSPHPAQTLLLMMCKLA